MTLAIAVLSLLLAGASLLAISWLWLKLRAQHRRTHQQALTLASITEYLAHLSRSAARSEARARLGERGGTATLHAQHGEEFLLWERCGFKPDGVFIEIGAYNGVSLSNSLFFEQIGWRGMLVEAHPDLVAACRSSRPGTLVAHAALGTRDAGEQQFSMVRGSQGLDTLSFSSTDDRQRQRIAAKGGSIEQISVPARTLASLVAEHRLTGVDWVSIDVEGAELEVLKGAALDTFKPRVLLIEDNSGGTDSRVPDYLRQFGYVRVLTIGCNDLYEDAKSNR